VSRPSTSMNREINWNVTLFFGVATVAYTLVL
jgi:hypothetical protein